MINLNSRRTTQRIPYILTVRDFKDGTITLLDETRMPNTAAKQSTNLYQTQDGLWTTRPGTATYGNPIPAGNIDGFSEYVTYNSNGTTTTKLIIVGNGYAYVSQDGGTQTQLTGATFTAGIKCFFKQVKSRLYITNGTDPLAYYDGSVLQTYAQISAPGTITPALGAGLTTGSYTQYYQVVALNSVGYTTASPECSITMNRPRNQWVNAAGVAPTQTVTLTWGAVTGATRYDIYSSDTSGSESYLTSVGTTTYVDDGSMVLNPFVFPPLDNTTTAPKFKQMELSGNRIWATGDPGNPYRVYFGGTGIYQGYFSPAYGGGYIDLELGGTTRPNAVAHYRDGKGTSVITVLCSDPEGLGTTWQISLGSLTVGGTAFVVPSGDKVVGSIGSNAPYGVVKARDAVIFFNPKGFYRLGNVPQLLNILSTDELSANIRPNVQSLSGKKLSTICGYYRLAKLYYSVPSSDTGNDQTWIYDTERGNWQLNWNIGFTQFGEYTDSGSKTHFLAAPLTGSSLVEISENTLGDSGTAFNTSYISGLIPINRDDKRKFAKIKYAYIELGNPVGNVTFEVLGTEKKKGFSSLGIKTITDTTSNTGLSIESLSAQQLSTSKGKPAAYSSSTIKKRIRINRLLNNIQFHVSSSDINTKYTLLSLEAVGNVIPTRDPQAWSQ